MDGSNSWVASLPFKEPRCRCPDNRTQAVKHPKMLCHILEKNPGIKEHMVGFMQIFKAGHAVMRSLLSVQARSGARSIWVHCHFEGCNFAPVTPSTGWWVKKTLWRSHLMSAHSEKDLVSFFARLFLSGTCGHSGGYKTDLLLLQFLPETLLTLCLVQAQWPCQKDHRVLCDCTIALLPLLPYISWEELLCMVRKNMT